MSHMSFMCNHFTEHKLNDFHALLLESPQLGKQESMLGQVGNQPSADPAVHTSAKGNWQDLSGQQARFRQGLCALAGHL